MTDPIPARLAALKTASTPALKARWRDLFDTEPPPFNRQHLESRLAFRIQELAYGGLKPDTLRRLEKLAEQVGGISWRCRSAFNSLTRKGYATCRKLPSHSCLIHWDLRPIH